MLVLSEIFHNRSESFKYFYDIGMWAGALVTVLCSCFYIMTIDFLNPKDLFEKVRKDKFSLMIFKQFTFWVGFLAIIGWSWLYAYFHYQLISYICLAGTFVYVVIYFLVYYIIRKEGKKFQRKFSIDISSSSITASDTTASDFGPWPFVSSNYTPLFPLNFSDTSLTFSDIYRSIIGDSNDPRSDQSGADPEQLV